MRDDRNKRLYTPNEKIKKIMEELGPDLMEYFDDISKPKKLKKKGNLRARFSIGDIVTINDTHGTVIYGPYKSDSNKETYEIEMEDGDILTVEDNGKNIVKYTYVEDFTNLEDE